MSSPSAVLSSDKINLAKITFLLVDDNPQSLEILSQVIVGFGVNKIIKCTSASAARAVLQQEVVDFILTDAQMPGEDGYQFIEWVRRHGGDANRFVPAIIITGHTRISQVAHGRDCGAHFIIAKPITPKIILERIFWVGRDTRMFIESKSYCGVDRRFKREGPPEGVEGRRAEDVENAGDPDSDSTVGAESINSIAQPAEVGA